VNQIIPGWTEALQLMKEGAKWQLFIPPGMGYGDRGAGPVIGPNSVLLFEVELIKVK
jgi:FKBP-type peptidyl-prolyl cis-trans isomerase FklB